MEEEGGEKEKREERQFSATAQHNLTIQTNPKPSQVGSRDGECGWPEIFLLKTPSYKPNWIKKRKKKKTFSWNPTCNPKLLCQNIPLSLEDRRTKK